MKLFTRQYFSLIKELSSAWLKERNQRAFLGTFWNFLNPLIITLVLFLIFRRTNSNPNNYYFLYILVGTIAWNFLSSAVQSSTTILLWRQGIVKNIAFPKEILIFAQFGVFFFQRLIEIAIVIIFIFALKQTVSIHLIALPLIIISESLLVLGLSLLLSIVGVYAQDMEYVWATFVRIGFFLVPIFYFINDLPANLKLIVIFNPASQFIIFYRDVLIDHQYPNYLNFVLVFGFSLILMVGCFILFKKFEKKLAEKV